MKTTSSTEFRNIIAEEYSWMLGKLTGMRPGGENNTPAAYYAGMPADMRVFVDQCADRIAARVTGQSTLTGELTQ